MAPEVWLGDLIRAVGAGVNPHVAAELLGLVKPPKSNELTSPDTPAITSGTEPLHTDIAPEPPEASSADESNRPPPQAVPMLPEASSGQTTKTEWLPGPTLPLPWDDDQAPEPTPLLAPRTAGAVLHALLSTTAADGEPDVEAITRLWSAGKPIRSVPRKPRRTLRFGVQVLVDTGQAMQLFARDQRELIAQIRAVGGIETTAVGYFADVPTRGTGPGGRRTWRTYVPPSQGSRVLLLSDFGIGGPAIHDRRSTHSDWRAFFTEVRRAGCSPVGLLPYPSLRWPDWLASSIPLLLWDRSTTAGHASMCVRR